MFFPQPLHGAIRLAVGCVVLAIGLRTWLVMGLIEPMNVAGDSMSPALDSGDSLWINRTAWKWREPRRWETVVALNPHRGDEYCVKRIVGLPGETVELRDGRVVVAGAAVVRAADSGFELQPLPDHRTWQGRSWKLGPREYFLLGDNASVSLDSRRWGPVPRRFFIGKPMGVR